MLRQKFGSAMIESASEASRHGGKAVAVAKAVRTQETVSQHNHLTTNWLRRLGSAANNAESREAHSQLVSLLDFYNNEKKQKPLTAIDWDGFRERIHTSGVVDKIHAKYDKFMESEYSIESAVSRVGVSQEKIKALDTALQYNFMLYFVHYVCHLDQLETMHNIGDLDKISMLEMTKLWPGLETLEMCEREIGNISPESYIEDGRFSRLCTQFNWGTRYTPPFSHSQDAVNCVTATLGKMGN